MITDILMRMVVLQNELPEEEFEIDLALETAIEDVDREVSADEREELDELLPEWFEDGDDSAQKELVTDGGTQQRAESSTTNVYADEDTKEVVVERDGEEKLRVTHGMARTIAKIMRSQADEAEKMERIEKFGDHNFGETA